LKTIAVPPRDNDNGPDQIELVRKAGILPSFLPLALALLGSARLSADPLADV